MTRYFISRHGDAIEWFHRQGIPVDQVLAHLPDAEVLQPGDCVYGTLPIPLVAEACRRGARYWHLVLPQQLAERGVAHTADAMEQAGAKFTEYTVQQVAAGDGATGDVV